MPRQDPHDLNGLVESALRNVPDPDWGVADMERLAAGRPETLRRLPAAAGLPRAVVLAVPLPSGALIDLNGAPTPLYMHHYRQLNHLLDRAAYGLALALEAAGFRAVCVPASQYVQMQPHPRGHISHRVLAFHAGLGFIGRSRLLIHRRHGPRVRLVSVLTDAPLTPAAGTVPFDCGDCTACVEACPAGAVRLSSEDYDLDACFAKLREFRKIPFVGQHICGVCIKVCPKGRTSAAGPGPATSA